MPDDYDELLEKCRKILEAERRELDYRKWWAVRKAEKIAGGKDDRTHGVR
jgi:hypothetical protein